VTRKSILNRESKRQKIAARCADKRNALRDRAKDQTLSMAERIKASMQLQKLPRDASRTRQTRRCALTGRPHAVYRRFGISRLMLRIHAMRGNIPGLVKSSW